ncbi:RDD family protein [Brachybacterium saurashtrense]|uniref:FHA domain-containing protein n=1 Tax=Brachybacterium saurashtrense TaxID=556288 RepID=A0A345YNU7_9MICO|nr:RDD family protein [Brachybacterium saurashtrense]AXK45599.1 FHA domain-containing protein [Brachybacterium saurashtrense]RRR21030.1 FHA domain-containing protein [Brachybacterium saurashtrense]
MNETRYCSTCGTLLSAGAVICGECGARYQASPYQRRATDAPGAWSAPPVPRSRDLGAVPGEEEADEGIELITRESLEPKAPGATALRPGEQYDRMMVTQPPMSQNAPGAVPGAPSGGGSPAPAADAMPSLSPFAAPLDGCVPAPPAKRLIAAVIDGILATLVMVPLIVGTLLIALDSEPGALLPFILIGVGVALPVAYTVLIIWLSGAKGFTLGKLILGLRVTRGSAPGALGFLRALGRWFLYGLVPLIMALSIFIDPRRQLRGLHDRAVDSVVVDVKAGRNPLAPRPDNFERASSEHYLGSPSVAVTTHENLMAEPGAAWRDPSAEQHSAQTGGEGWGQAPPSAPSPYAPPVSRAPEPEAPAAGTGWGQAPAQDAALVQSTDSGWAPPPIEPMPAQDPRDRPRSDSPTSWGRPSAEPQGTWGPPSAEPQGTWGPPSAEPQGTWGPPSAEPQPSWEPQPPPPSQDPASSPSAAPPQEPVQSWGPPPAVPHQEAAAPVPPSAPADGAHHDAGAQPAPSPSAAPPSDITGDAWAGQDDAVDEQTRLTAPDDPLGDLEQTRISAVRPPEAPKLRLVTDDGAERIVEGAVVVGRNPSAGEGEVLFVMRDETRSVSKTHLRVDGTGDDITVTDLGSTNGSAIQREDGTRESLVPDTPTVLPEGARLSVGDRTLSVERVQ